MENSTVELYAKLDDKRKQSSEMAVIIPPQVAKKLRYNASLRPSRYDFDSNFEFFQCRLDENDNSQYPAAAKLIEDMRLIRQAIHNLQFKEEQGSRTDTMTC